MGSGPRILVADGGYGGLRTLRRVRQLPGDQPGGDVLGPDCGRGPGRGPGSGRRELTGNAYHY
jgi:hypothetical protein